jgi:hypothetical protein
VRREVTLLHRDADVLRVGKLPKAEVHHPLQDLHQGGLQDGETVVVRVVLPALALTQPPGNPVLGPVRKTDVGGWRG